MHWPTVRGSTDLSNDLKRRIRLGVAHTLRAGSWLTGAKAGQPRILMYHRVRAGHPGDSLCVDPALFADQIAWLAEHAALVPLREISDPDLDTNGRCRVAITFDDGYLDNLVDALPVLEKHGVPATLFVTSEFCDQSLVHPRYQDEKGQVHMNWEQVRAWDAVDGLEIGSHTLTHPTLPLVDDAQAEKEIIESRKRVQDGSGSPVDYFAYPNGAYIERDVALCQRAGYAGAVTTHPGSVSGNVSRFELKRTEMNDKDHAAEIGLKLGGAFDLPHKYLDWRRQRKLNAMME